MFDIHIYVADTADKASWRLEAVAIIRDGEGNSIVQPLHIRSDLDRWNLCDSVGTSQPGVEWNSIIVRHSIKVERTKT